jgi:uncharacterized protein YkwD
MRCLSCPERSLSQALSRGRNIGLLALLTLLSLPVDVAHAVDPSDIVHAHQRQQELSIRQRATQRANRRLRDLEPSGLDARRSQRKPSPQFERQSQRVRRRTIQQRTQKQQTTIRRRVDREKARSVERTRTEIEDLRQAILDAVNRERNRAGVAALRHNGVLQFSAQAYAEDLLHRAYFSHTSPDGENPQDRIQRAGYGNLTAEACSCRSFRAAFGENLAKGQKTIENVMEDWMESPDHKRNILSDNFAEIGVGIVGDIWVQHFGSVVIVPR